MNQFREEVYFAIYYAIAENNAPTEAEMTTLRNFGHWSTDNLLIFQSFNLPTFQE